MLFKVRYSPLHFLLLHYWKSFVLNTRSQCYLRFPSVNRWNLNRKYFHGVRKLQSPFWKKQCWVQRLCQNSCAVNWIYHLCGTCDVTLLCGKTLQRQLFFLLHLTYDVLFYSHCGFDFSSVKPKQTNKKSCNVFNFLNWCHKLSFDVNFSFASLCSKLLFCNKHFDSKFYASVSLCKMLVFQEVPYCLLV